MSYQVEFKDGRLCKRHLDQLLKDNSTDSDEHQADKDIIKFPLSDNTSNSATIDLSDVQVESDGLQID